MKLHRVDASFPMETFLSKYFENFEGFPEPFSPLISESERVHLILSQDVLQILLLNGS